MSRFSHILKTLAQFFGGEEGRPLLAWRIILAVFFVGVFASSVSAYLAYRWSLSSDTLMVAKEPKGVSISDELLKEMVSKYEEKEKKFIELSGGGVSQGTYQPVSTGTERSLP